MSLAFPLTEENRASLRRAFAAVARVDLAIDAVLEGLTGTAQVDRLPDPEAFRILVPPFAYFAGDPASPGGRAMLAALPPDLRLMPSASGWLEAARALRGERLTSLRRHRFSSAALCEDPLHEILRRSPFREKVEPIGHALARRLFGREHFVDLSAYASPEDFAARGAGFHVSEHGEILGAAYASLSCSRGIEVSLYVQPGHRRRGMGTALACHLVLWSLERGLEPHWDAANAESCRLAQRLGYRSEGDYLAHCIADKPGGGVQ